MFLQFQENKDPEMIQKKQALINEQTSPLQRIMWIYNAGEPQKRTFENNVCAFHIGKGYFLSVAHNLRLQAGYFRAIDEAFYKRELYPKLDGSQSRFMEQMYFTDTYSGKKYLNNSDPVNLQTLVSILKQKRFDTRWVSLAEKGICNPYLVFQFRENSFYNDAFITRQFDAGHVLYDADAHKYTYLVEVELVKAFYSSDIALYRIVSLAGEAFPKIPHIDICYDFLDESAVEFYCLQSSPSGPAGRLLNVATIEGMIDHFGIFPDEVAGNYLFEGYRYLVKSYFRFGSSGAPYICFDADRDRFAVNAIQSEASGIQFSIKNDREGNVQYVNAIASPLSIIRDELEAYLSF